VIKIFDFGGLRRIGKEIADILESTPGATDIAIDQEPAGSLKRFITSHSRATAWIETSAPAAVPGCSPTT
jgi:hypothetical protein